MLCPAYYNTGRSQLWVKGLVKGGWGQRKLLPVALQRPPYPTSRAPESAPAYCALTLSLSPSRGPLSYRSVPRPGAAVAVLCVELEGHGLFQAERQTLRLERHLRACVPRRLVVLHARVCVCVLHVERSPSCVCGAGRARGRGANPNASCLPSVHSYQLVWPKTGRRHGQASQSCTARRPTAVETARRRAHTTGCRRRTHGISTRTPRKARRYQDGDREGAPLARHCPHVCAAPAPGSTRSRELALVCCTRC